MLAKDFVKLIVIALVITSPASWWLMHKWLDNFAYRIDIPAWIFISSGFAAMSIALVTISFQSIKAATANPVKNLKAD